MGKKNRNYIPALTWNWLTPLYDFVLRFIMREQVFKQRLVNQANPQCGDMILDLGCGTGTLTLMLHRQQPEAGLIGLDGDENVLKIAHQKSRVGGFTKIHWEKGLAFNLPNPGDTFSLVVSCLVIHHLILSDKRRTFNEVFRILKPEGSFHIADFGLAHNGIMRLISLIMSRFEQTADNFNGQIPVLLEEAGFENVEETAHLNSIFGPLSLYRAIKHG
jgi:ubiquinone/menaquinone biosynthesis C-methylase UbiE